MTSGSQSSTNQSTDTAFKSLAYRHGYWAVAGRALNVAVTAVSGVLLARSLSTADFGKISVIQTAISICSVAASLGLGVSSLRLLAQARHTGATAPTVAVVKRIRGIVLLFVSSVAAIIGVMMHLFSERLFRESTSTTIALLIGCGIFLRAVQAIVAEMSRGFNEVRVSNLLAGWNGGPLQNLLFLAAVCSAAIFSSVSWKLALGFDVAAMAISVLIGVFFFQRTLRHYIDSHRDAPAGDATSGTSGPSHDLSSHGSYRDVLAISFPIMLTSLVAFAIEQGDIVLGGFVCSEVDLPLYAAAKRCSLLMRVPFAISNMAVIGLISQLYLSGQIQRLQQLLQISAGLCGFFALAITAVVVAVPDVTLSMLFGGNYSDGGKLLFILSIGQLGVILTGSTQQLLLLGKGERIALLINLLGLATIITTALPAYRLFGRNGFAVSYAISLMLVNLLQWFYVRSRLGIKTEPDFVQTFHLLIRQLAVLRKLVYGKRKTAPQGGSEETP